MFMCVREELCVLLSLGGIMFSISEAQGVVGVLTPVTVIFHPFKTKRGGKGGFLAKEKELRGSPHTTPE